MKIEVLEKDEKTLKIKLLEEDHTLANLLTGYLRNIEGVTRAFYDIPHPLTGNPVVYIMTDGTVSPEEALKKALETIKNDLDDISTRYQKALEGLKN